MMMKVPIVEAVVEAAADSMAALRADVSHVRYQGDGIAFLFRGITYEAPEPYPYVLTGVPETDAKLAVRAILDKTARRVEPQPEFVREAQAGGPDWDISVF